MSLSKSISAVCLSLVGSIGIINDSTAQVIAPSQNTSNEAQDGPGIASHWAQGNKTWIATSYETYDSQGLYSIHSSTAPISRVWVTASQGILNEVYYPTADEAQIRDQQLLITDGKTFFHEERRDTLSRLIRNSKSPLDVEFENRDPGGRYIIRRKIIPDPSANRVLVKISIDLRMPGLKFYLLHNMAIANSGFHDTCQANLNSLGGYDSQEQRAQVIKSNRPFLKVACGFEGALSDGFQDISRDFSFDAPATRAENGNVVATAELDVRPHEDIFLSIGFGSSLGNAALEAWQATSDEFKKAQKEYLNGWNSYFKTLTDISGTSPSKPWLYFVSAATLKAHEDKTYPGAFVASLSNPWGDVKGGEASPDQSHRYATGGYHLVWPRDLYHVSMAFIAMGDLPSAKAALTRYRALQLTEKDGDWPVARAGRSSFPRKGSYWQNTWVNGKRYWESLQIDQVGFPILLGLRLLEQKAITIQETRFLEASADFIDLWGPWTLQDRWEETHGISPNSGAVAISALFAASELAEKWGDHERSERYRKHATDWATKPGDNIDAWTFTSSGFYGNGKYYLRVDGASRMPDRSFDMNAPWDPNDDRVMVIANREWNQAQFKEKAILDFGFLDLVRLGLKSAKDPLILESLPESDSLLRVDTPHGPSFYRYNEDSYGDNDKGHLWVLLTGERGHYELASGKDPLPYLRAMENFANEGGMLPEQVWESGLRAGQGTGSATPLAWSHAEYVRLLRSVRDQKIFDTPSSVKQKR